MIDRSVLQSAQKCFEKKSRVVVKMVVRYGDYGLRTTDGRHFRTGTRHMCSVVPTAASSRRCVVEGFHVVQRGVVRGTEDGMKQ